MTTPIEIPVFTAVPLYKMRVTLEGKEYILQFDWNDRETRWYMSISDLNNVPISTGIKVVANWPLLRKIPQPDRPPGTLMAVDFSPQNGEPPVLEDFGLRVKLLYSPSV